MSAKLNAGASTVDISPQNSQFLFGYPQVKRYSTGIHDPLLCSALYLDDGVRNILFLANDLIYLDKKTVGEIRTRIHSQLGIFKENIMVSCTHTHSGPVTVKPMGDDGYSTVPDPDPEYLIYLKNQIIHAAVMAKSSARPAEIGLKIADNTGTGTNRRNPDGPRNPIVPVLSVRETITKNPIALMLACSMHPTVLHEDSLLVSADFPGMTRLYLKNHGFNCPILYSSSPAGNQSPRYVTRGNTFEEAERIGSILGKSVEKVLANCEYTDQIRLQVRQAFVQMPMNDIPEYATAQILVDQAKQRFDEMKTRGASTQEVRTAECDWFGTERRRLLASLKASGRLASEIALRQPAEVQLIAIGPWKFVAWPGEIFVEFALDVMHKSPDTYVLAYTNGENYGYLVTEEAVKEGGYEASSGLFKSPRSPQLLVEKSLELISGLE